MKRGGPGLSRRGKPPRLRTLLGLVAFGALALPGVLGGAIATVTEGKIAEGPLVRYLLAAGEVRRATRLDTSGRLEARPDWAPPPWLDLIVTRDGEGSARDEVIVSTLPGLLPGSRTDLAAVAEALASAAGATAGEATGGGVGPGGNKGDFHAVGIELAGRRVGTYYAFPRLSGATAQAGKAAPIVRFAALAAFALFAFVLGAVAAARIAGEVLRLERAAVRIASGDLESPIAARGAREIVELAGAMDAMRAAIREDLARRARFLAAVSHDLRTPLTSIGGYLEAIEDGMAADPEALERYVAIMRGKARTLESRIASLIEFARMETGEWRMGFEEVELEPFFAALARGYAEDAALLGRGFAADFAALAGMRARIDKALLPRAIENLVSNAFRYAPEGSAVRLGARVGEGAVILDLDDEGPGLPEEEREKVFEPFFRGSAARAQGAAQAMGAVRPTGERAGEAVEGEGAGLGLYIARSIIRGHGWELLAGRSPSGGGRFSILMSRGGQA